MKCPCCQRIVSADAKACPNCGKNIDAYLKAKRANDPHYTAIVNSWWKIVISIIVPVVIISVMIACSVFFSSQGAYYNELCEIAPGKYADGYQSKATIFSAISFVSWLATLAACIFLFLKAKKIICAQWENIQKEKALLVDESKFK